MIRHSLIALSVIASLAAPAAAEGFSATQVVERAVVSVNAEGEKQISYEIAEEIAPGDELRYRLSYVNQGSAPAENVRLVMPVPGQVKLIEGSAASGVAEVTFSVDNGETFAQRGNLTVQIGGTERAATAEEITHIRWNFVDAVAAGAQGDLSYRGVLQ